MVYKSAVKRTKRFVRRTHKHGKIVQTVVYVTVPGESDVTMKKFSYTINTSNEDSDDTMEEQNATMDESRHIVEP